MMMEDFMREERDELKNLLTTINGFDQHAKEEAMVLLEESVQLSHFANLVLRSSEALQTIINCIRRENSTPVIHLALDIIGGLMGSKYLPCAVLLVEQGMIPLVARFLRVDAIPFRSVEVVQSVWEVTVMLSIPYEVFLPNSIPIFP